MKFPKMDLTPPPELPLVTVIVPREEWGAAPATGELDLLDHPIEYIWLRETARCPPCLNSKKCLKNVKMIQDRDMGLPHSLPDIQANFLVGDDGRVYEGRGWFNQPEKRDEWKLYEREYIEVQYMGPFKDIPEDNAQQMLRCVWDLMRIGEAKRYMLSRYDIFFLGDASDYPFLH